MTLLAPALLSRLERLQLATRRPLAGHLAGEHRSPRRGSSLDFADYRDYHPGDDYRRIDYHLLARLDVLLIKLFEADDDLTVRLLVDRSASMATEDKSRQAARLAAALGFVALVRRDVVMLHTFPGTGAPMRYVGRTDAPRLFADLETIVPSGPTPVGAAIRRHLAQPGPPGLTVVVSDLLTPDWELAVTRPAARGGDLAVVHVLARSDLRPDLFGDVDVVDRETTQRVPVSLAPNSLAEFADVADAWQGRVAGRCRQVGAAYVQAFADDDPEHLLLARWRRDGVLR